MLESLHAALLKYMVYCTGILSVVRVANLKLCSRNLNKKLKEKGGDALHRSLTGVRYCALQKWWWAARCAVACGGDVSWPSLRPMICPDIVKHVQRSQMWKVVLQRKDAQLHGENEFALELAAACGHEELVNTLVTDPRANFVLVAERVLYIALECAHPGIAIALLSALPFNTTLDPKFLLRATKSGMDDVVSFLLSHFNFTENQGTHEQTVLTWSNVVTLTKSDQL